MRRISLWALSTITTLVLLLGYHTSTSGALTAASGTGQTVISASVATGSASAPTSGATTSGGAAGGSGSGDGVATSTTSPRTVTGDAVDTRYGPVQVQVTVDSGTLTEVSVLQYPSGNREDEQINGYALPILVDETIAAQGAQIDMVSGATYTSEGYLQSLQSALDQAVL